MRGLLSGSFSNRILLNLSSLDRFLMNISLPYTKWKVLHLLSQWSSVAVSLPELNRFQIGWWEWDCNKWLRGPIWDCEESAVLVVRVSYTSIVGPLVSTHLQIKTGHLISRFHTCRAWFIAVACFWLKRGWVLHMEYMCTHTEALNFFIMFMAIITKLIAEYTWLP